MPEPASEHPLFVRPAQADLRLLAEDREGPRVSLYLPLRPAFPEVIGNAVRYGHAIALAADRLSGEDGLSTCDVDAWSERLGEVETDVRRLEHPVEGIAVFLDRELFRAYLLTSPPRECVVVEECFALRDLIREVAIDRPYRLLALSMNRVALFEGDAKGLRPRAVPGLPASLEDALGSQRVGRELFYRTSPEGNRGSIFQGHGGGKEERKLDLERFHRVVASALERELRASEGPLLLAADSSHDGPFRGMARLPGLLEATLSGNPDHLSPGDLHQRAWPLVREDGERRIRALAAEFDRVRNRGKGLVDLDLVFPAAASGRVRRLWLDAEARVPGRIERATGRIVDPQGRDGDVLDAMAGMVLRAGGEVLVVSSEAMPASTGLAAELY